MIPGHKPPYGDLIALSDLEPGTPAVIRRISEIAEHEARSLLQMLAEHAIKEGSEVRVTETQLGPNKIAVLISDELLPLSIEAARLIWVEADKQH